MSAANELWWKYRKQAYRSAQPLAQMQERECSLAFYAGMEAAFMHLSDLADGDGNEEKAAQACEDFRQQIKMAALQANLDRS